MEINSRDYHDYVFKNGKLVGEFEQMYRKAEAVPWHQDTAPGLWHGRVGTNIIEAAFETANIGSVIEVGCGYGYILSKICRANLHCAGFDIAPTAIERAKALHPSFHFFVDDLLDLKHDRHYDLVICRENLWYVTAHLDIAMKNLGRLTAEGGFLYIGLCFPSLDCQFVGKDVLPDPGGLLAVLERDYVSVAGATVRKYTIAGDGPHFHWLGRKRS